MPHKLILLITLIALAVSFAPVISHAESYIGVQLGLSKPMDFGDFRPGGSISATSPSDVDMASGLVYGIKAGHYFDPMPWLGFELDAMNANPHLGPTLMHLTPSGTTTSITQRVPGASLRVFTLTPLIMVRCPNMTTLQPYMGIGPTFAFAKINSGNISDSDNGAVGFMAKMGLLYHVTSSIALFGEWKYTSVDLDLRHPAITGMTMNDANYTNNAIVAGISYHFGK